MAAADPAIEIIIPNWNGKELLADCLQSLKRQTSREFSVTVVDNGSRDGSVDFLRAHHPEVKLIAFKENTGFSVAVNAGIQKSSSDWIFLLNNDIEVAEDCLAKLLDVVQTYPDYDSFAVKMMSYHQRSVFDGAGDAVLRGGVGYRVGTLEEDRGQYETDRDVFGACAGAALYSRRFFEIAGLFDEDFFAYLEDVDLNMRAVQAGLRCRYVSSAVVYHIGSASTGSKINPMTIRLSTKNNINVLVKNYPLPLFIRLLPVICVYQLMWLLFVCKKLHLLAYLKGLGAAVSQLPAMHGKRKALSQKRKLSIGEFSKVLAGSEREAVQSIMDRRSAAGKGNWFLNLYMKIFL